MSVSLRKQNHAFIACKSFLPRMNELSIDFRHRNNKWTLFRKPSVILLHTDSLNSRTLCKVINGIKLWHTIDDYWYYTIDDYYWLSSTVPVKRSYWFYPVEHVREWCKDKSEDCIWGLSHHPYPRYLTGRTGVESRPSCLQTTKELLTLLLI